MSLNEALESALSDHASTGAGTEPATAEGGESESALQVIGAPEETNADAQEGQSQWELAEGLQPDMVVGKYGDQTLTARELQQGYLRQSDYTKKTTELAEQRREQEQAVNFYRENSADIERLYSEDPNVRKEMFMDLAQRFLVDLGPTRDDGGRFASKAPGDALEQIRETYGEESIEFQQAAQNAQLQQQVATLTSQFDRLMGGITTAQQQQEARAALDATAGAWRSAGMSDIDIDGAMRMVGQAMTPDQAMKLANFERIVAHNLKAAQGRAGQAPDEPGGVRATGVSPQGKSLREFTQERFAR